MVRSLFFSLFAAGCLVAQDEPLRRAFEGKTVVVKIDMPGDDGGVNLYPRQELPVDYRRLGDAVKRYGVALRKGDEVTVTKVHLKPKLIEFQLGGGGYGSWGDMSGRPSVPSTSVPKSRRERDLEKDRDSATGDRRRTLDRELDYLRRDRQREESQLRIIASRAQIEQQEWEAERRRRSGSRFNIHYPEGVSSEAASPQAVMAALAEFVDFGGMHTSGNNRREEPLALRSRPSTPAPNPLALKKGMSEEDVDQALGAPVARKKGEAAGLPLIDSTYDLPETTVKAQFVNGVLAKYTITAK